MWQVKNKFGAIGNVPVGLLEVIAKKKAKSKKKYDSLFRE